MPETTEAEEGVLPWAVKTDSCSIIDVVRRRGFGNGLLLREEQGEGLGGRVVVVAIFAGSEFWKVRKCDRVLWGCLQFSIKAL